MAVKLDLPTIAASGEAPLLLDANSTTYNLLPVAGGTVFVETYAQKKTHYKELAIGTPSVVRPETYLIKEQNFRDIGGGFWKWERHYAVKPESWFDYQLVSFSYGYRFFIIIGTSITQTAHVNTRLDTAGGGTDSTIAAATRTYYLKPELDALSLNTNPPALSAETPATFTDAIIREDEINIYAGNIYERIVYTATFTVPVFSLSGF